jgi:hypothetical protein
MIITYTLLEDLKAFLLAELTARNHSLLRDSGHTVMRCCKPFTLWLRTDLLALFYKIFYLLRRID